MNKKLLAVSIFSVLTICMFGIVNVMASENSQIENFQKRFGIALTEEQKAQIETKKQEMETKRAEDVAKWQSMTLEQWKSQEIQRINSVTEEQFNKMKEQKTKMMENNGRRGFGKLGKIEKPAE